MSNRGAGSNVGSYMAGGEGALAELQFNGTNKVNQISYTNNNARNGYATGGAGDAGESQKMRKIAALAASDKETIESQQKKIMLMRHELEEMKKSYGALKRNYESVSHYAAKDNAEYKRIKGMKDSYEEQIATLKASQVKTAEQLRVLIEEFQKEQQKSKDLEKTVDEKQKEIDALKKDLLRRDKLHDDKMSQSNQANRHMME